MVLKAYFPGIAGHDKYFVVSSIDFGRNKVYGFFINSERNPLSDRKYFVLRAQIQIDPGSYDFLDKPTPSFIDSFKPYPASFSNILTALIACPSKICGQLSVEHLKKVDEVIQDNPTLNKEQKTFLIRPLVLPVIFLS